MIVAVLDPSSTIVVTVNGYGEAPATAPLEAYAVATEASLLAIVVGTHDADSVIASAAVATDNYEVFNA